MKKYIPLVLTVFLVMGCDLFTPPPQSVSRPGISLTIAGMTGERTILPDLDMVVATYDISGTGPNGDSFNVSGHTGATYNREVVEPGAWTITVNARNAGGTVIGSGSSALTILPNATSPVTVTVNPLAGTGILIVMVSWPSGSLASPAVTGTLQPKDGTEAPITFAIAGDSASYTDASIDSGYYLLKITVADGSTGKTWILENVRIAAGATSTANYPLTLADINAPPAAPTNLVVTAVSDVQINLAWSDNSLNEVGFKIERGPDAASLAEIAQVTYGTNTYSDTTVSGGTTYYYRITAYNSYGSTQSTTVLGATKVSDPGILPDTGTYAAPIPVTMTCGVTGATIYYTTNGLNPVPGFCPSYSSSFNVNSTCTLKAVAYKPGCPNSNIVSKTYTVTGSVNTPVFSPVPGIYHSALSVTITGPAGSTIVYTTNQTNPVYGSNGTLSANPATIVIAEDSQIEIRALAYVSPNSSDVTVATYRRVAQPVFTPAAGAYNANQSVSINVNATGVTLIYTTDGTDPSPTNGTQSTVLPVTVSVTASKTLKALAVKAGWTDSLIVTSAYIIRPAAPAFDIAAGTYYSPFDVQLSTTTTGAQIYYTTDGVTAPTSATGTLYTAAINMNRTMTIRAIAVKDGWSDSTESTRIYSIKVTTPVVSPASTQFIDASIPVSISCATAGATIIYTIDGTTPSLVNGQFYSIPFTVSSNLTVKVIGFLTNWTNSDMVSRAYTVNDTTTIPADGGSVDYHQPISFNWNDSFWAENYQIQVNTQSDFLGTMIVDNNTLTSSFYQYTTNLVSNQTYYWRLKIKKSGVWENWLFLKSFTAITTYSVTIGAGTTDAHLPIETFYGYTYSQSVFTPADIGSAMSIKTLKFDYNGYEAWTDAIVVYMGHTTKTNFTGSADWIASTGLTQVYSGSLSVTTTAGWVTITLPTPFAYNGIDNLVIAVDENTAGWHSSSSCFYATLGTVNQSIYFYADSPNPDPISPPAGVLSLYRPNVILQNY